MATSYATPGVYIEEVPSGSMPIQGVGTAVAAFVGFTEKYDAEYGDRDDPEGLKPQLVTSWPQYARTYGGFARGAMLPFAVRGFFDNGGSTCYIVRVGSGDEGRPSVTLASAADAQVDSLRVQALEGLEKRPEIEVVPTPPPREGEQASQELTLRVYTEGVLREELTGLSFAKSAAALTKAVNDKSTLVRVELQNIAGVSLADRMPASGRYPLEAPPPKPVAPAALEGSETARTGYQGLSIAENVTMVAIPDLVSVTRRDNGSVDEDLYLAFQGQLVDWCEQSKVRMAILDPLPGLNATDALDWRQRLGKDSAFGTCYFPNVVVRNPLSRPGAANGDSFLTVPPSGHVAGVWARTDGARGVWKAPANEVVRGIVGLETTITDGEQGQLNPVGVNCIRSFGVYGVRLWGARTIAQTDPSWRYINVRRLFIYVEESIRRGTQWAVFEPNDRDLWERVKRNVSAFLRGLWQRGALVGATPEQAFYVLCDETNNPPASVDRGELVVEVGIAPVKPAEFVIFRISQWQGGAATTE